MKRLHAFTRLVRYNFAGRRPASPLNLQFLVTTRCNMSCRHCSDDVWGDPKEDLSFLELETFSNNLGHVEEFGLGGGEPFLRNDLADICELFVRKNRVRSLGIVTNSSATDTISTEVRRILEKCPEVTLNIMLSLDGFALTHDAIRKPGAFDRTMEMARRLTAMKKEFPLLSFNFNATIHSANWRELPALARLLRKDFNADLEFNVLSGNPRDSSLGVPSMADLEMTINGIYAARDTSSSLIADGRQVFQDVRLRTIRENRQLIPCRAGSLLGLVYANGDVRACPQLPSLGNLRDNSFQSIWHSDKAQRLFHSIRRGSCACNGDCFLWTSLSTHWKFPFLMLQQRLKRLVPKAV
jgi:MoaA/NifB/PqqE/SkfB family radical SAM enzyme